MQDVQLFQATVSPKSHWAKRLVSYPVHFTDDNVPGYKAIQEALRHFGETEVEACAVCSALNVAGSVTQLTHMTMPATH